MTSLMGALMFEEGKTFLWGSYSMMEGFALVGGAPIGRKIK
jgi:hypothetical protein